MSLNGLPQKLAAHPLVSIIDNDDAYCAATAVQQLLRRFTKACAVSHALLSVWPAKRRTMIVYEAEVVVGRERVIVRLLSREAHVMLERELIQADGTSFVHAVAVETHVSIYDYLSADPYFMQLERHYCVIQEKIRKLGLLS